MKVSFDLSTFEGTLEPAKAGAIRYRLLTGKPLGTTAEAGEFLVSRLLGLELSGARQPGYDAVAPDRRRVQIKARCLPPDAKPGQRVGSIRLDHEWDTVVLILLDQEFEPLETYEAERHDVEKALSCPGVEAYQPQLRVGVPWSSSDTLGGVWLG